jgi:hypothetical protein
MKEISDAWGLPTDIAWREEDRIYGDGWLRFLGDCKTTLATESGSNVFDRDGSLALRIQAELARNPAATYEQIHAQYLKGIDGQIAMNQISPKVFEAIACRTVLILFEGRYSGVLEPEKHYIPLKKDFSDVAKVLERIQNDADLEAMAERAFTDIVASGKYSYRNFVGRFDRVLSQRWPAGRCSPTFPWLPLPPCDALPSFRDGYAQSLGITPPRPGWRRLLRPVRAVVNRTRLRQVWDLLRACH